MKWNNSWGDLAAGAPLRGLGPYTPDALGTHNYKCVLDVNNTINEIHEDNNVQEVLFKAVK
jgi:subtilase family serine protease